MGEDMEYLRTHRGKEKIWSEGEDMERRRG
jgi:hypothetical protein